MVGPVSLTSAAAMKEIGALLASVLRRGDLVLLSGPLGAGKTTLTQGIAAGMAVHGDVTSPTFVIARVHRSAVGGPDLVHVDAYRLASLAEVDDLDLDASLSESVTVVEWGEGKAEALSDDRLVVEITRSHGADEDTRTVTVTGVGLRWSDGAWARVVSAGP